MNSILRRMLLFAVLVGASLCFAGCPGGAGGGVQGNTYQNPGYVVVVIEFKSGGKAYVSTGPVTTTCTYKQEGKKVTLVCEGDTTIFTVNDDGSLSGPPMV